MADLRPKPAPLLFGLPLLLWGWQSGRWLLGGLLALLLEWAQRTPRRWALGDTSLLRLADLTALAMLALVLFHLSHGPLALGLFALLHWSPLVLLPLLLAQLLSGRSGITRRALFYSQRRSRDPAADRTIDLVPIYLAAVLLAAGQDSQQPQLYFLGLFLVIAWLLWWQRPRRPLAPWVLLMSLALAAGLLTQAGLREVQGRLGELAVELLSGWFASDSDPFRSTTALGDLGRLQLSDRILYRIEAEPPLRRPLLLRSASYDRYVDGIWLTRQQGFAPLTASGPQSWQWGAGDSSADRQLWIGGRRAAEQSILPLPLGTWRLDWLPVAGLERHPLGAIRTRDGPRWLRYRLSYRDQGETTDAPPGEADLRVPPAEQPLLAGLVERLGLADLPPSGRIERLAAYFRQNFRYSLKLPGRVAGQTAIGHFLRQLKQGHCEYFASASVLLLRQAGIPARYAVGYSVQEQDGSGHYLVRHSHGHAWTLYWHRGRWWNLDTTPAIWAGQEADARPFWRPLLDALSELRYRLGLWQEQPRGQGQNPWLWGLLGLLFLALAYRLRLGRAYVQPGKGGGQPQASGPWAQIERQLDAAGYPRQPWETYGRWLGRLRQEPGLGPLIEALHEPLRLHYRQRYGLVGLAEAEQQRLAELLQQAQRHLPAGRGS
ncbi:MAG: transglutaminase domain-containing protein [Gammaproteobacteria bacterium SHHR-1]